MSAAVRVRRSRGSVDLQVRQSHPICGTPYDVPVPRNTSLTSHDLDLEQVRGSRHFPRHAGGHDDAVARLRVPALEQEVPYHGEHRIVPRHVIHQDRGHAPHQRELAIGRRDRKSTRLNSSHVEISYAVFCLKKKNKAYLTRAAYPSTLAPM